MGRAESLPAQPITSPAEASPCSLRLLLVSHLYPRPAAPGQGVFIEPWAVAMAKSCRSLQVVSPQVYVPPLLRYAKRYAHYRAPAHESRSGLDIHRPSYLRPPGKWFRPFEPASLLRALRPTVRSLHKAQPVDLLLAVNLLPDGWACLRLAEQMHLPVVVNVIGSDMTVIAGSSPVARNMARRVCCEADLLLCQSAQLRQQAIDLGASPERAVVFRRGLDMEPFEHLPSRQECRQQAWPECGSDRIIVFVGRLGRRKGVFDLLEAFAGLGRQWTSRCRLGLIGEPAELDALQQAATRLGVTDRLIIPGHLGRPEVLRRIKGADLLVLPSHSEGMPNVVLEAFAAGVPVVASRAGGLSDLLAMGPCFRDFETADPASLTDAMRAAMEDASHTAERAELAQGLVRESFDLHRNARSLLSRMQLIVTSHIAKGSC